MTSEIDARFEHLIHERQDRVARIWLNRPQQRNAQSQQMLQALDATMALAERDDVVNVVVLAGKGEHFSARHDLRQAQTERGNFTVEERWSYESRYYFDYCLRIFNFPKLTIAQVQGACISGSFTIANMCDLIVAVEDAYFSDPVGHALGTAATEVLIHPWVLGLRQAKAMLFTGARILANEAREMGMVNRVVPRGELDANTIALAHHIAKAPPFGLRLLKRSLNRCPDAQGLRSALDAPFRTHQLSHASDEFKQTREKGLANAIQRGKAAERRCPAFHSSFARGIDHEWR